MWLSSIILESITLVIYLFFKIYFLIKYILTDAHAKIWTEISYIIILGRDWCCSCRVHEWYDTIYNFCRVVYFLYHFLWNFSLLAIWNYFCTKKNYKNYKQSFPTYFSKCKNNSTYHLQTVIMWYLEIT